MPKYHLHLRGGWQDQEDTVGAELPDPFSAELVALAAAKELLRTPAYVDENIEHQQWFEIVDDAGVLQAIVPVKAAILSDVSIVASAQILQVEQVPGSRG